MGKIKKNVMIIKEVYLSFTQITKIHKQITRLYPTLTIQKLNQTNNKKRKSTIAKHYC